MRSAYPNRSHLPSSRPQPTAQKIKILKLKQIKYPINALQPASHINQRISLIKSVNLREQISKKLLSQKKLNAYRKVRGDGNCFFRALAYSYLSNVRKLNDVKDTFSMIKQIKLTTCHKDSIPKDFKEFYHEELLKDMLINHWKDQVDRDQFVCNGNNKRILLRMFRRRPCFDFIVILYFRAVCFKSFEKYKNQPELKQFMQGTEEQRILTYGQQSEGVLLQLCSRFLKINLQVYQMRTQQIKHYRYSQVSNQNTCVYLLYYQNHYDIIQILSTSQLNSQKQDLKKPVQQFYTQNNSTKIKGNCIQCGNEEQVYEESFLCQKCYQISIDKLKSFKKDRMVLGSCIQCRDRNVRVSQQLSICQRCIKQQDSLLTSSKQQFKSPQKRTSPSKRTNSPQRQRNSPLNQNYLQNYCQKCQSQKDDYGQCRGCDIIYERGRCIDCNYMQKIQIATNLCRQCKEKAIKNQKNVGEFLKCYSCGQSIKSQHHKVKCINKLTKGTIDKQQMKNQRQNGSSYSKCPQCKEFFGSQLHKVKCIQKLTRGRIDRQKGEFKASLNTAIEICSVCRQYKVDQKYVNGCCQSCYKSKLQKSKSPPKNEEQRCIKCNGKILTSSYNGICTICYKSSRYF